MEIIKSEHFRNESDLKINNFILQLRKLKLKKSLSEMSMVVKVGTMSICKGGSMVYSSSAFSIIAYHPLCMANTFSSNSRSAVLQLISNRIFH